ncbi:MAG: YbgC/FadM family acyl-CoA thioesterase [Ardenticatenaceae bacterium]
MRVLLLMKRSFAGLRRDACSTFNEQVPGIVKPVSASNRQYAIRTTQYFFYMEQRTHSMGNVHVHPVTIYYEDTDVTGLVYHPNYLKYFERARSELFGGEKLRRLQEEQGVTVAVYRADIVFKKGAYLGDRLEIHTQAEVQGDYRIVFHQKVVRASTQVELAAGTVELVCVANERLTPLSSSVVEKVKPYQYAPTIRKPLR